SNNFSPVTLTALRWCRSVRSTRAAQRRQDRLHSLVAPSRNDMTSPIHRLLPIVALGVVGTSALAQDRQTGWTYTMNVTTDSGDAARRSSMATRHQVMGLKARMEFVQVSNDANGAAAEGVYQIFNGADSTVTMVMPGQHMATIVSFSGLGITMPALPNFN